MALYRGIAGEPGGVRKLASSLGAVCLTVMLCLKSSGNEICPGSRFKSCSTHSKYFQQETGTEPQTEAQSEKTE